jgi:hypothetical protein
MCFPVRTK